MSTTIRWGGSMGGQTAVISHPSELRAFGYPRPPLQAVANWATEFAAFQNYCIAGTYQAAIQYLIDNYCFALLTDVPSSAQVGFQTYVGFNVKTLPVNLQGPISDWTTSGKPMDRAHPGDF